MKRTLYIFACLLVAALASCNKALDQAPDGKISLDEVFADNDKTMYYLNSCYSSIPGKALDYFFWARGPVNWCDDAWDADDLDVDWASSARLYKGDGSASNHPFTQYGNGAGNHWSNYFARIRNCAVFLQNIPTAAVDNETDRSRWTAEAHLLRAYYYMELLLWYGTGLPLVDSPYGLDTDFATVKKASYYETAKFIIADCDAALSCPDLPWRITNGSESLRVTKALAWAIKAKAIVFAASPLYNDGENHWDEAYDICKQAVAALEGQGFKLYTKAERADWTGDKAFLPNAAAHAFNE
ncbi:MAG: RagB/SusD family nutrient uptake outer membrane protein, partial [Candidatus Cryptobacteroides sp.]